MKVFSFPCKSSVSNVPHINKVTLIRRTAFIIIYSLAPTIPDVTAYICVTYKAVFLKYHEYKNPLQLICVE